MRNIFINGNRGIGKSTLIRKLLADYDFMPVYGFVTKKEAPDENGDCSVYIHSASAVQRFYSEKNLIGTCNNCRGKAIPAAFDDYGLQLLSNIPNNSLVIMDEIGFFESKAFNFQKRVKDILSSDCLVLAAIKDKPNEFLDELKTLNNTDIFNIEIENRNELYLQIKPILAKYINELKKGIYYENLRK